MNRIHPLLAGLGLATAIAAQTLTPAPGLTFLDPIATNRGALWDDSGTIVHVWPFTSQPGVSSYLAQNGDVLRSCYTGQDGPGLGGRVERVAFDGRVLWSYVPPLPGTQHHDIHEMPNGNVLMIVTDELTPAQALALGQNPLVASGLVADQVIEVRPTGPTSGEIVWRWRAIDHLVQSFNAARPNFGVVANRRERIHINYPPPPQPTTGLWLHMNCVDYNPDLDQIVVSCRNWNELWVIDHSTTTQQAAGSTGGRYGRGGDLLYRWGNPAAYGTAGTQHLMGQHDVHWIPPGRPGAGNLICFNNLKGTLLGLGAASAVTELVPAVDPGGNYPFTQGAPFGPAAPVWEYLAPVPTDFFSAIVSSADRLPNGNTLVCSGTQNHVFELGLNDQIVWEVDESMTFKARRYERSLWQDADKALTHPGDSVGFHLLAGTEHAGEFYFLGGSASGTDPGTTLFGVQVPLNLDPYMLTATGSALLPGSIGQLDPLGRGRASFVLPPLVADAFDGLVLHHAFVSFDGGGGVSHVSNPVGLELVGLRIDDL
ncbi:MAG: aryl-sulfate sulfotransferase [Planctomycetota bacterium]